MSIHFLKFVIVAVDVHSYNKIGTPLHNYYVDNNYE